MAYLESTFVLLFFLAVISWFLKQVKNYLFWLYLWQLKNYHFGRFLAHFKTESGKRIISGWLLFFVFFVLASLHLMPLAVFYAVFILEGFVFLKNLFIGKLKRPEFTKKIIFLGFFSFAFLLFFSFDVFYNHLNSPFFTVSYLFLLELLAPLIVSFVVIVFQPLTIVLRNRIIKKATRKRKNLNNLLTVGITGSFGKSSVKEFLKTILSSDFKVAATEKNENSEMGVSEYILKKLNEEHEIFICEMGAYNRGGIKLLCSIAGPKIGIITGINNQHLATFGSQENIIKAKFELIDCLPEEGLAILNWDSEPVRGGFKKNISNLKYGVLDREDVWAEDVKIEKSKLSFRACFKNRDSVKIEAEAVGEQNVSNLLAAIAVARKLGMGLKDIASACRKIKPKSNLFSFKGIDILDFSYSSNPSGVLSHLDHLKHWSGKKVVVMPCLIELGTDSRVAHEEIGKKIAGVCDWAVITSKECLPAIKKQGGSVVFMNNPLKIREKIIKELSLGDVVLLEGRVPEKLINLLK